MKVDLMYTIHYIPHPWDKDLRDKGCMAYCLCREVRMPVEEGNVRGKSIDYEPVAMFNFDSEGVMFEEFCYASIDPAVIEPRQVFVEMKKSIESARAERRKR